MNRDHIGNILLYDFARRFALHAGLRLALARRRTRDDGVTPHRRSAIRVPPCSLPPIAHRAHRAHRHRCGRGRSRAARARSYAGRERELRTAVAQRLKAALTEGRAGAEQMLLKDRHGRRCAERLCVMQDEIIRMLFELAGTLYRSATPSDAERMAVVATGGYGRGLLAPGSDIDLLFLLPYKQTAWGESVAEGILYCLWDMGLKVGHATRSVDECIRQAKADMTIRTALLEARYLLGDRALFDEFVDALRQGRSCRAPRAQFVAAKLAEREERLRRAGQSRYLVEPNVKDGKGGLRDLHTLFWIAKYVYRVREPEELIEHGVFDRDEFKLFRRCEDFLWAVRCHMHFVTGRAEERLSFDIQREIAVRLGYTAHPGMQDVERFMKHYFLVAKDVGDLTAILCAGAGGARGEARCRCSTA